MYINRKTSWCFDLVKNWMYSNVNFLIATNCYAIIFSRGYKEGFKIIHHSLCIDGPWHVGFLWMWDKEIKERILGDVCWSW